MVELMEKFSFTDRHKDVAALLADIEDRRIKNDKLTIQDPGHDKDLAQLTAAARSDRVDHLK